LPLLPQLAAPLSRHVPVGSGWPSGTLVQMPIDVGCAHDLHALAQPVAQQTPCAQLPDEHSRLSAQNAPFSLSPQELSEHALPGRHCTSVAHAVKQRAPLQANGAQARASGAVHWPVALQVEGGV
jgi:hypothetical protein